ncbi:glycine betaine/proline transport system ATP-binding protein [Thalassospira sp. MBR-102]|jgi:glycine betaine/proline transport system ATP-binding protein|uniref:Quaternary amine transport ATP-binding protein n=3 Tax=Thalassospira TaxID=168934 RepID=A0ABR5XX92_9PROT|nr:MULTISPECIES: glycine betaine/L-proline ABC transporter ATP-binding protein ProV [Thalassospira]MBR9778614.1 glycine betaine/L-proline ABC transporter ATP-binding protein ProV [Rhodospirillales bacterium]AJD51869.1 proline/glycine betaine ABC transporter ATPase [Thalassospira xiamenensis M-5 = DSM 17429]KEO58160.1 glycine/betaine ABC transporter ATP-binding protein [Thalassospira permensis NBRC 106175]KZC97275.1 glycine betaine/L-proline ABC transporter ATP-binding protein [Thalassospira xia|tara:strand:- start:6556 stop:7761 length:1206 start_codon:yes stop_codon:yes gene_type:complete
MTDKIVVKDLYKVFGDRPDQAMQMINDGIDKAEIFDKTGQTVGVCGASFTVRQGEIFVVMGLSGSGKSTLVRLLNRLIEPTSGQVLYDGTDIAAMNDEELRELRRRDMSMVFQSFALMPHMSVVENAAFGLELAGVAENERHERALNALDQVGLKAQANSYPDELSGGMQQRVGLARALANDPSVMLMDEAFSALDPLIRTEMQDELLTLQREHKRTIIFISHDLDEAMRIGDRIAIMEGGIVVQVGTPEEILNNPANDYVKSFFRGVDVSTILTAKDIVVKRQVTVIEREGVGLKTALNRLRNEDREYGYIVGDKLDFHGIISVDSVDQAIKSGADKLSAAFLPDIEAVSHDTQLSDLIGTVAHTPCGVPVVNENGKYLGVINRANLLATLDREGDGANG